jgi:hypothetical protein
MRRSFLLLLFAVGLMLPGCVTRYIVVSEVAKSDLQVVVFTDDTGKGEELLQALAKRGYDNDHNHVAVPTDDGPLIKWGGASAAQIEEIAAFVEGRYEVELERDRGFKLDDYSVFITLPSGGKAETVTDVEREDLRIVIFTSDTARGNQLLSALRPLGYTNDENYSTDEPNEDFNIKWGAATDTMIDEIIELADSTFDIELDRQHSFETDDHDVFVNLPFGDSVAERHSTWDKAEIEITVFCDSEDLGKDVLSELSDLGYNNEENEVLSGPNDDFNLKYGGLPETMLDEIAGSLEAKFKTEFRRSKDFGDTNQQVFINLPKKD